MRVPHRWHSAACGRQVLRWRLDRLLAATRLEHAEGAVRCALAEITKGVCTDESGLGRYEGPCASEVGAVRRRFAELTTLAAAALQMLDVRSRELAKRFARRAAGGA